MSATLLGKRYARPVESTLHCSFCGKPKDEVRKLIAGGGRQVAVDRVLPAVFICDECIGLCGEILEEGATEPEVREELAEAAESLVVEVINLLHAPPPGYAEMPRDLGWVSQPLGAVKEALAELRADRPYPASTREPATKESLDAKHVRAWELIDAHRVTRRRNPPPT
jgi:hypothetical protein